MKTNPVSTFLFILFKVPYKIHILRWYSENNTNEARFELNALGKLNTLFRNELKKETLTPYRNFANWFPQ